MKERSGSGRSGDDSEARALPAVYFVLIAAVLLVGIGVASGTGPDLTVARSDVPPVPKDIGDLLYTFGIILWIVGLPLGMLLLLLARGPRKRPPYERSLIAVITVALVVGGASLLVARSIRLDLAGLAPPAGGIGSGEADRQARSDDLAGGPGGNADFRWEVVVALAAVGALATASAVLRRREFGSDAAEEDSAGEVIDAVDLALDDLHRESDPRRAITLAFGHFERMLSARRLGRRPHETPVEYVGRVLRSHTFDGSDVQRLLDLFQLARFSVAPIDGGMKDEVISCLGRIRHQLPDAA